MKEHNDIQATIQMHLDKVPMNDLVQLRTAIDELNADATGMGEFFGSWRNAAAAATQLKAHGRDAARTDSYDGVPTYEPKGKRIDSLTTLAKADVNELALLKLLKHTDLEEKPPQELVGLSDADIRQQTMLAQVKFIQEHIEGETGYRLKAIAKLLQEHNKSNSKARG